MPDIDFVIEMSAFNEGQAPLAHLDTMGFIGNKGQASEMKADVISNPGFLQQSPGLANLTNGDESGVVDELIRFILDRPTAVDTTYGVGTTKLFKITATAVVNGGTPAWPQNIPSMTGGESVIRLKENLFVFYNTLTGGDIAAMPLATEVIDPDWGSSVDQALENAPHPSAAKEDILVFGNGRYLGVFIKGLNSLNVQKLDFGEGSVVADVVFNGNLWWIAVNYGEGRRGQIYVYDGSAISNQLSDEAGLGNQQIGFLYVQNGIVFVAYDDKTSDGFAIGYMEGRTIKPLRYFSGSLPDHRQKTLYKNTILFVSQSDILSVGAAVEQLPIQISKLCAGGYPTIGAIAAPFGVPMIASTDGSSNYRLAQLSQYSLDSYWKSLFVDLTKQRNLGKITTVIVQTKPLEEDAHCILYMEGNQDDTVVSNDLEIAGTGKTRHVFTNIFFKKAAEVVAALQDFRVVVDYSEGLATKTVPIRKIIIMGTSLER